MCATAIVWQKRERFHSVLNPEFATSLSDHAGFVCVEQDPPAGHKDFFGGSGPLAGPRHLVLRIDEDLDVDVEFGDQAMHASVPRPGWLQEAALDLVESWRQGWREGDVPVSAVGKPFPDLLRLVRGVRGRHRMHIQPFKHP